MKDIQDFEFCLWHKPRKWTNLPSQPRCLGKREAALGGVAGRGPGFRRTVLRASQRCARERISPHTEVPFRCTESSEW